MEESISLADGLLIKPDQNQAEYQQQLDSYKASLPKLPAGGKSFPKYRDCLIAAAQIGSKCWEAFTVKDAIIHRGKKTNEAKGVERDAETMLLRVFDAVKKSVDESADIESGAPALTPELEKKLFNNKHVVANMLEEAGVKSKFSASQLRQATEIFKARAHNQAKAASEMPADDYEKASKQIRNLKNAIEQFKDDLDELPNDDGTKSAKRQFGLLINNFNNHANNFLGNRRDRNA